MKKEDVPQDESALGKVTREVVYATDSSGRYVTELSEGWQIKVTALDTVWGNIEKRINAAKEKIANNEASPLLFFMEKALMDITTLAKYTGFWAWQIKRHLTPDGFKKLSDKKLKIYARVFDVTPADLINSKGDE